MKWPTVLLPEVAGFDAPAPRNGDLPLDSEVGFLSMSGLDSDSLVVTPPEMRRAAEVAGGFTHFQNGDVLVAKITPCFENGKTAEVSTSAEHCFGSTEFHVIRANESRLLPRYLTHYLRQPWVREAGRRRMTGSAGQRRVPRSFLQELHLPLPPLEEQRRIAAILDKADALRQKRHLALQKLDSLTQSIFIDMFGDPTENPRNWGVRKLAEITGKITDGEHLNPLFSAFGMPIVMAGNVLEDSVDLVNAKRVKRDLGERFRRKCNPASGDLLVVSRGATIGRMCVVRKSNEFCLMGSVILIKPVRELINTEFLAAYLKHPAMRNALYRTSGSSAQQAIYLKDLKELMCIVPPMRCQTRFAAYAVTLRKAKSLHQSYLASTDSLFDTLQHSAFRGEL